MEAARTQFDKLGALMDSMTTEALHAAFSFPAETRRREAHWQRDRCVRDVLVHLHEWHRLLLSWVEANQAGRPQPFLPEPYTWRTYGTFNEQIWRDHQPTSLDTAVALLHARAGDLLWEPSPATGMPSAHGARHACRSRWVMSSTTRP